MTLPEFQFGAAICCLVWSCCISPGCYGKAQAAALLAVGDVLVCFISIAFMILTRATGPWWEVMNSQHVRTLGLSTTGVNRLALMLPSLALMQTTGTYL